MHDVFTPLTDDELAKLDEFLLNRFDDESEADDKDEGIYDASSLDGFFTAIVSGPVMTLPSQWMPALWGDFEPVWENENDFSAVFSLLIRHMNSIASHLINEPESFEPLFTEHVVEDQTHTIVDDWCYGYMIGVTVELEQWQTDTIDMQILLAPLMVFGTEEGRSKLEDLKAQETENIRKVITSNVREIYAYWLARRDQHAPAHSTVERSEPHVGRNDPCPCGSGKKYKKCCLH